MHAVIFDIDGTLLESFQADCELFVAAIRKVLRVPAMNTDWATYPHMTDAGILREVMRVNGIDPDPALMAETRREFIASLHSHVQRHGPFREVPGAVAFVSHLLTSKRHYVAYATGAWHESAMLKLGSAGFPTVGVRVATSSDHEDRVSIMRNALAAAPAGIQRVTYYGDGVWDQRAVRELGWEFVPVGAALGGIAHYYGAGAHA